MAEYEVTYADLEKSISDFGEYSGYLTEISGLKGNTVDSATFEGPAADFCLDLITTLTKSYSQEASSFKAIQNALSKAYESYKTEDTRTSKDLSKHVSNILNDVKNVHRGLSFGDDSTKACELVNAQTEFSVQMVLGRPLSTKWTNYCAKVDGNWMIADGKGIVGLIGGQTSPKNGIYPYDSGGCDNYARGYCLYAQTGKVPRYGDVGLGGCGLTETTTHCSNSDEQAKLAFQYIHDKGQPVVIHTNSPSFGSGSGHWLTVVGYKQGTNKNNVKMGDLIVVDSATGTVRACSEEPAYCASNRNRCSYERGYQLIHYD